MSNQEARQIDIGLSEKELRSVQKAYVKFSTKVTEAAVEAATRIHSTMPPELQASEKLTKDDLSLIVLSAVLDTLLAQFHHSASLCNSIVNSSGFGVFSGSKEEFITHLTEIGLTPEEAEELINSGQARYEPPKNGDGKFYSPEVGIS